MKRLGKNKGDNRMMMVDNNPAETPISFPNKASDPGHRWYECKTCGKKFDSFQALGGHQGTHRKLNKSIDLDDVCLLSLQIAAPPMSHQCKMCTKKFDTGQALGGHMRRHKLQKYLILMDRELLRRRLAAEEEKLESDLVEEDVVELRQQKAEEDEQDRVKSELVLAAKELRLGI